MAYEEDTCMAYEEEDTCVQVGTVAVTLHIEFSVPKP
jgi:hypothetical protein